MNNHDQGSGRESGIKIKYFGWSCFTIETSEAKLVMDPIYREYSQVKYAELSDFTDSDVICITHGHQEHYRDVGTVAKDSKAKVVAPVEICNHLRRFKGVSKDQMRPTVNFEPINIGGFTITPFPWRHRDISPMKAILRPRIHEGIKWAWGALLTVPFYAPFTGYHIRLPDGSRILNYGEGFNSNLDQSEFESVHKKFETDILLTGTQLDFKDFVSKGVEAFSPDLAVLYHPHAPLFKEIKVQSASPQDFERSIKTRSPGVKVVDAQPGWAMKI